MKKASFVFLMVALSIGAGSTRAEVFTILTDPSYIDTVSYDIIQESLADIHADRFVNCPEVYRFDHWEGPGIADPFSSETTVILNGDTTITAVFIDDRKCGDECHPNFIAGDLNHDCIIDLEDIAIIVSKWLLCTKPECDTLTPPVDIWPNPSEWEVEPTAVPGTLDTITMTASLHHSLWCSDEELEYFFDCIAPSNGPDSGWTSDRVFTVSGLAPQTYLYVVRVRDPQGNVTDDSASVMVTPGVNFELPQGQWLVPPYITMSPLAIQMEAMAYQNYGSIGILVPPLPAGYVIKYQFDYTGTAQGGDSRAYDLNPVFVDEGVVEGQNYSYRTRLGLFYEPGDGSSMKIKDSPWSQEAFVVAAGPDLTPPTPNPAQHATGSPTQIFVASRGIYYHVVTAVAATDPSGVEYRFIDMANPSFCSGGSSDPDRITWRNVDNVPGLFYPNGAAQVPQQYWAPRGFVNASDGWYILVRDRSPNQNTTAPSVTRTIFTPAP